MDKEKIEYYTVRPNLKQMYGKKVTKDTEFTDKTEDGVVEQEFKDLTLTTRIKREYEVGEFKVEEESTVKTTVPDGTILIWSEQEGFIVPQYQMTTLEDLKQEIADVETIYNEEETKPTE